MYEIQVAKGRKYWYAKIISTKNGQVIFSTPTSQTYSSRAKVLQTMRNMEKWLKNNTLPVVVKG